MKYFLSKNLNTTNGYFFYSPVLSNLNISWNFGNIAGIRFVVKILIGILLVMHCISCVNLSGASEQNIICELLFLPQLQNRSVPNLIYIFNNVSGTFWSTKRYFYKQNLRAEKRIGPHSWEFMQFFVGLMLGDGHLGLKDRGARLDVSCKASYKLYAFYLQDFLLKHGYHHKNPEQLPIRVDKNPLKGGKKGNYLILNCYHYRMRSFTFSSLIPLRHWWYNDKGVKIVPTDLSMYLTPFCLAIWFMGDGSWQGSGLKISTDCFTYKEVSYLTGLLKSLYDLDCTIRNSKNPANKGVNYKPKDKDAERGYMIYIRANSVNKFKEQVSPHMSPDMLYKLGPTKNGKSKISIEFV